jgi:hypothetical protein
VYASEGYGVRKISNDGIDWELSQMSGVDDCVSFAYTDGSHQFYVMTFLAGNKTFVYDLYTNTWHTRSSRTLSTGADDRWAVLHATAYKGKIYCGAADSSVLTVLNNDKYTEYDGRYIIRERISPTFVSEGKYMRISKMQLDMESGNGNIVGQGVDPQVMLQTSSDGGHAWSSESWRSMGRVGNYAQRVVWYNLGMAREWTFRFVISDPVPVVIFDMFAVIDEGGR